MYYLHLSNEMRKLIICEALPRMLSFTCSCIILDRKCNILFIMQYFAFACIDNGPYCQESYLILLINRRHVATYV